MILAKLKIYNKERYKFLETQYHILSGRVFKEKYWYTRATLLKHFWKKKIKFTWIFKNTIDKYVDKEKLDRKKRMLELQLSYDKLTNFYIKNIHTKEILWFWSIRKHIITIMIYNYNEWFNQEWKVYIARLKGKSLIDVKKFCKLCKVPWQVFLIRKQINYEI